MDQHDRMKAAAQALRVTFDHIAAMVEMPPDEAATALGWGALEWLAVRVGRVGAIERLRSISDVAERQVLEEPSPWDDPGFFIGSA